MAAPEADPHGSGTVLFSDGFLRAVQASDGSPISGWKEPGLGATGVPVVIGEQVCLCDSVGYLTAYDGAKGGGAGGCGCPSPTAAAEPI